MIFHNHSKHFDQVDLVDFLLGTYYEYKYSRWRSLKLSNFLIAKITELIKTKIKMRWIAPEQLIPQKENYTVQAIKVLTEV